MKGWPASQFLGGTVMTPSLSAARSTFLVLSLLVSSCGGMTLDLGRDKPPSDAMQDPDATIDETLPQIIAPHQLGRYPLATDDTPVYWSTYNGNPNPVRTCAFDHARTTTAT